MLRVAQLLLLSAWGVTAWAIAVEDYAARLIAAVGVSPRDLTLSWSADPEAIGHTIFRLIVRDKISFTTNPTRLIRLRVSK